MERRVLEEDELRTIKVKRNAEGGIDDVVDPLAEDVGEDEELIIEIPEPESDEYDEDLVGLTPEQLKAELARREQAEKEAMQKRDELIKEGQARLSEEDFEGAVAFFEQATLYDSESEEATRGLWLARTRNFTDDAPFYKEETALLVAQSDDQMKAFLREQVGERLSLKRAELEEQAAPLRERVAEGQNERRGAFQANRAYYLLRFSIFAVLAVAFAVGCAVSASFLVRTTGSAPLICLICFAALTLVSLIVTLLFSRKLVVANRLCRANERLSSTEEGAQLEELEQTLDCLKLVLDDHVLDEE